MPCLPGICIHSQDTKVKIQVSKNTYVLWSGPRPQGPALLYSVQKPYSASETFKFLKLFT